MMRWSAKSCLTGQHGIVRALGDAEFVGALAGPLPGDAGARVVAFGEVNQLGQRVGVGGVERGDRALWEVCAAHIGGCVGRGGDG